LEFIGAIDQIPPTYSAIKIGGKKMYEAAREGKPMEGKARRVTIYDLSLREGMSLSNADKARPTGQSSGRAIQKKIASVTAFPRNDTVHLPLTIHCSSGTYIRALARDLGRAMGGGGYVEELRRTAIGPFSVSDSHTLDALPLIPIPELLHRLLTHGVASANLSRV
jgi:tRNA pseudouridine55 synthase